jgi:hypothetical protein
MTKPDPNRYLNTSRETIRLSVTLWKFAAVHASACTHFNQKRCLSTRPNFKLNRAAALAEWRGLCAA